MNESPKLYTSQSQAVYLKQKLEQGQDISEKEKNLIVEMFRDKCTTQPDQAWIQLFQLSEKLKYPKFQLLQEIFESCRKGQHFLDDYFLSKLLNYLQETRDTLAPWLYRNLLKWEEEKNNWTEACLLAKKHQDNQTEKYYQKGIEKLKTENSWAPAIDFALWYGQDIQSLIDEAVNYYQNCDLNDWDLCGSAYNFITFLAGHCSYGYWFDINEKLPRPALAKLSYVNSYFLFLWEKTLGETNNYRRLCQAQAAHRSSKCLDATIQKTVREVLIECYLKTPRNQADAFHLVRDIDEPRAIEIADLLGWDTTSAAIKARRDLKAGKTSTPWYLTALQLYERDQDFFQAELLAKDFQDPEKQLYYLRRRAETAQDYYSLYLFVKKNSTPPEIEKTYQEAMKKERNLILRGAIAEHHGDYPLAVTLYQEGGQPDRAEKLATQQGLIEKAKEIRLSLARSKHFYFQYLPHLKIDEPQLYQAKLDQLEIDLAVEEESGQYLQAATLASLAEQTERAKIYQETSKYFEIEQCI